MPASKCRAHNSAKLCIIPEATQLAVVATIYQGNVIKLHIMMCNKLPVIFANCVPVSLLICHARVRVDVTSKASRDMLEVTNS